MEEQAREQVKMTASEGEVEVLKRQLEREASRREAEQVQLQSTWERRVQEVRDQYEREVLPQAL